MRQKRAKSYRKLMTMYQTTFGFRQPYQLLVDSSFCLQGARTNLIKLDDAAKLINGVLQGHCKLMITQCCITELYKAGSSQQYTIDLAKSFERRKCNHMEAIAGDDCMLAVIGPTNKHRYVIASQSDELRNKLREIPATPIIHINRSVLVLEPPSDATMSKKHKLEDASLHASVTEMSDPSISTERPLPPKRHGPKGPNPLSVKKKKKKDDHVRGKSSTASIGEHPTIAQKRPRDETEGTKDNRNAITGDIDVLDGDRLSRKRRRHKPRSGDDAEG